ncbi:hypothetical protein BKP43_15610 [Variovorax boronicumulans]|uniref:rolling circle replication-associated protein n=1 Tax=Variovorax boronicumulans TaxID=436515 RepID=UPI000BB2DA56|nr:hypothetical protein [Variovorax boronicumulans]PBI92817.1 hypothetical protein BKP43_15610 [Variovorax boronicumulans]
MRERVIEGVLYREEVVPGAWTFEGWRANGHHELSTRPAVTWVEVQSVGTAVHGRPPGSFVLDSHERALAAARDAQEAAERRVIYQRGNARRARTRCRRYIKASAFDEMLTLTYRSNQVCIVLCKAHFESWVRRMKRALGGEFTYCAAYERQHRGAWHVHVVCHKLPRHVEVKGVKIDAWKLGTQVWRSVVGDDGGLCFVGGRTRHGSPARRRLSCAQMASYVSKYITKHYDDVPDGFKSYSHSKGLIEGERYRFTITGLGVEGYPGSSFADAVSLGFDVPDGARIVSWRVNDPDREWRRCWLVTEPIGGRSHGQE